MPFTPKLFATVKLGFISVAVKVRVPARNSRVAAAISTSAGEPDRVGTFPEGGLAESFGKRW